MIDIRPDHLKIIKSILLKHVPDCKVLAFGSRVTLTAKEYSDLDLAIVPAMPLPPLKMALVKEDFSESDLPFKVDVLDWSAISEDFKRIIEKDCEVLHYSIA
ncbi:MAG: nucleotidyltransferase family protein [Methanosarcinaceae archaeon]